MRITWEISTPMVEPDHPIHLDALLAFSIYEETLSIGAGVQSAITATGDLPVESTAEGIPMTSQLFLEANPAVPMELMPRVRSTDIDWATEEMLRGGVARTKRSYTNLSTGRFRRFDIRTPVRWYTSATAWCLGDRDGVEECLSRIEHIGKLTRLGHGRVESMTISEDPMAERLWRLRSLPATMSGSSLHFRAFGGCRLPYWDRANYQEILACRPASPEEALSATFPD